ncbi:MAG: ribbon-helix-helix domain-containing protein [archaeon]|nr:ribbon-helix-helix domain-containing protein [archaeon]
MVMDTVQIRISDGLVKLIDNLVKKGIYSNRSEAIRDAVRSFVWKKEVGTIKNLGESVEIVKNARKKLSERLSDKDLEEVNSLS